MKTRIDDDLSGKEILIVDDSFGDRKLLSDILEASGFNVRAADKGDIALKSAKTRQPDLILLDIRMSDMDGFEVCQRLKADRRTRNIPVMFISVLADTAEKIRAFEAGGVDYITKPFQKQEVLARVNTHLCLRQMHKSLEQERNRLEERVSVRTTELVNANRELNREITERKQVEKELREGQEKYRNLFDMEPDALALIEKKTGNMLDVNKAFIELYGYSKKEILKMKNTNFSEEPELTKRATTGPVPPHIPVRYHRKKDGTVFPTEITTSVFNYQEKDVITASIRDISERKQAEETLQKSEAQHRDLLEGLNDAVYRMSLPDGKYEYFSQAAKSVFGYDSEQWLNNPNLIGEIIHPDFIDYFKQKWADLIMGKVPGTYEYKIVDPEGNERWIFQSNTGIFNDQGKIIRIEGLCRDITGQKRMQETLLESERKYRSIMESMNDAVYVCSSDFKVEYMNPSMIKRIGNDAIGELCYKALHGFEEKCPWCVQKAVQQGEYCEIEIVSPIDNRSYYVSNSPLVHEDGSISKMTVYRDITEQKKLEVQFQQAQKMEAIGVLAGGVAHDFNNILGIIIGSADLALINPGINGSLLEEIKTSGERGAALTRQLLAFSRKQIIQPKILDFNKLLAGIEKMLGRLIGEDVEILKIPGSALWPVEIDPGQMEQIVMNLVINAKDAMPRGGKLTIETANMNLDENYCYMHGIEKQTGPYVLLAVSDTGIGMDKEIQEHIFEPFYTSKEIGKGTGLGLSTVYGIVKQNNGFIWVYSEPGQGSTFKVYLPKAKRDVALEEKEQSPVTERGGSETVLLVEDDDALRKLTGSVLKRNGYTVLEAENGEDALRISREHEGPIELMITDVIMPKMGGKEAAKRLKPLHPRMKVVYMSGYTDNSIVHHGVLTTGLDFLQKPFSTEDLKRIVRQVLDKKQDK